MLTSEIPVNRSNRAPSRAATGARGRMFAVVFVWLSCSDTVSASQLSQTLFQPSLLSVVHHHYLLSNCHSAHLSQLLSRLILGGSADPIAQQGAVDAADGVDLQRKCQAPWQQMHSMDR